MPKKGWRYQKGNQQPQIEDEQTTQDQQKWEKKTYNDLQNTAQKTTDWETRTSQKIFTVKRDWMLVSF
jgi:hypothetical protein